jgi:hypothetical protein
MIDLPGVLGPAAGRDDDDARCFATRAEFGDLGEEGIDEGSLSRP